MLKPAGWSANPSPEPSQSSSNFKHVDSDLLFAALPHSPGRKTTLLGRALTTYSTSVQLNDFRDWINEYCARHNRADIIPAVNGRPWIFSTSQFRRTLAWFIARQPGGSIAGAIQYRHMSVQMFEGYAKAQELHQTGESAWVLLRGARFRVYRIVLAVRPLTSRLATAGPSDA